MADTDLGFYFLASHSGSRTELYIHWGHKYLSNLTDHLQFFPHPHLKNNDSLYSFKHTECSPGMACFRITKDLVENAASWAPSQTHQTRIFWEEVQEPAF